MSKAKSQICRTCLESSQKVYPLVGTVVNVDVNIATMISYLLSKELFLCEDLPDSVCIPCFKTIRIAYNFLQQFKESEERLLVERTHKQEQVHNIRDTISNDIEQKVKQGFCEKNVDFVKKSINDSDCNFSRSQSILCDLETIQSSTERDVLEYVVDINLEDENILSGQKLQEVAINLDEIENEKYTSSLMQYVIENPSELDNIQENIENPSGVIEEFLILHEPDSELVSSENKSIVETKLIQKNEVHNLTEYVCPICNMTFHHLPKFYNHVVSHDADVVVCNKCPRPVELNMLQYIQHYREYHRYHCGICNRSLMSSYGFRYHMKQHENVRKYECPAKNCKKSFFLLHLLKKHMRTHSDVIKHICNLCGAKFRTYDTYRYHQKTHDGKRNHLCTECGKAFFQAVHLRDHMFRHTGYKRFTCDKCGNSFTTNSQLKKHLNHCRLFKEK